uniref:Cap-specific mRNA (nucleoside-2'-O-)-methyltransferase 2 n=1 Tax=Caenorhabditis tropicalis TaxID=1561998 RepID=A0A1I7UP42_9PELO
MCEGPGYFIEATYLAWLRNERIRKSEGKVDQKWEWNANTLNPYFENISCFDKLVDDSHIRGHMEHWFFGDSDDGDIRGITEDYLVNNGLAGSFDLVTADGSRNTQGQEGELEELVHDIIESEVRLALKLLRTNGRFVLKCYRFCHKPTRDLVLILAENFENIMAIKPLASRPGSSERYLICEGFGGRTDINPYLLLHCDEFFLKKQISRIEWHVNTFNQGPVSHYSWEERQQFLDVQKRRLFTAESVAHRAKIQQMFPQGNARDTSPWSSLYGHNLLRRLEDPVLVENAVLNFVNTYRMIPPGESPLQFEMMAQYCLCRELLVVTSRIPLVIEDTLFMEPIAFRALKDWKPKIYCDLFEYHSTLNYTTEEDWRRFWLTQNGHFMLEFVPQITIEHVLIAIAQGMDMAIIDYCKKSECDIVALQQLYDAPSEKVVEEKDYTIYFMKPNKKNKSLAFFVRKNKVEIDGDPEKCASSDIAILNFEINGFNIQLFNFYAPPRGSPGTDRAEFYEELKKCYKTEGKTHPDRLKILCGTFNSFPNDAQTGLYDPFILREVYSKVPKHDLHLVYFLNETKTYHLNSRFHKDLDRKWTWCKSTDKDAPKSENDGFLSSRPDMVRDVDVVLINEPHHRMVYSDWDITKKSLVLLESKLAAMKLSKDETSKKKANVDN